MPDENPTLTPAERDAQIESLILQLLTDTEAQRPWSDSEVAGEVGDAMHTDQALQRLHAVGLVHRCDGFAWATRAALRADEVRL
jgi:hypothetical protein